MADGLFILLKVTRAFLLYWNENERAFTRGFSSVLYIFVYTYSLTVLLKN